MKMTSDWADIAGMYPIGFPVITVIQNESKDCVEFRPEEIENFNLFQGGKTINIDCKVYKHFTYNPYKVDKENYSITLTQRYTSKYPQGAEEKVLEYTYPEMYIVSWGMSGYNEKTTFNFMFANKQEMELMKQDEQN